MDLSPLGNCKGGKKCKGKGKSDKSVKSKECFYCGKPGHNKNEYRNFSAALRKKSVQPDKAVRWCGSGSRDRQEKTFRRKRDRRGESRSRTGCLSSLRKRK